MGEASDRILEWTREMDSHSTAEWDRMPEIYLYMDQVITYMNGQLHLFERDENTALLTSSMINNYVKAGVLERPDKKKYGRDHLAMLTVICILKQVLSIPDIAKLLEDARGEGEKRTQGDIPEMVKKLLPRLRNADETAVIIVTLASSPSRPPPGAPPPSGSSASFPSRR